MSILLKASNDEVVIKAIAGSFGAILGVLLSIWIDIGVLIIISLIMILLDCYTAYKLSKRVKRKYGKDKASGKFKSVSFGKVLKNLTNSSIAILVTYLLYKYLMIPTGHEWVMLHIYSCGVVVGWQGLSMLENISSCNGAKWAIKLQDILIDKTKRHLDIDLTDFIKHEE